MAQRNIGPLAPTRTSKAFSSPLSNRAHAKPANWREMLGAPRWLFTRTSQRRTSWRSSQNGCDSLSGDIELWSAVEAGSNLAGRRSAFLRSLFSGPNSLFLRFNSLFGQRIPCSRAQGIPAQMPEGAG